MISNVHKVNKLLLISLLVISELIYLFLFSNVSKPIIAFFTVSLVNSIIFILIVYFIKSDRIPNSALILLSFGILFRITVVFLPVNASDDIYRYLWDGKVQLNHVNPYKYAPNSNQLDSLHSNLIPGSVNHPDLKSIYPPFSQYIFFISYSIFGENYFGFKFILLLFEILTLFILMLILKNLQLQREYIGIYSLCPLPIMQFMIDGHLDAIGISLLVLGLYFFIRKKMFISYVFLGFSISTKLITGMVLPYLTNKKKWRLLISIIVPLLVFIITYIPYTSSNVNPFESLTTFTKNWTFNGSIFEFFFRLLKNNQEARKITAAVFMLIGIFLFFSKIEMHKKITIIFFSFLLLTPTVHPWYVTWLAALLVFNFLWSGIAFITLVNLANVTVINYRLNGIWSMPDYILLVEYIPVYLLLIYEIIKGYRINTRSKINNT